MTISIDRVLVDLKQVFENAQTRWYVFGAQAVSVWGKPRTTADVDVTIGPEVTLAEIFEKLMGAGFEPAFEFDDNFLRTTSVLPVLHAASQIPVDIVVGRSGLENAFLERAETVEVANTKVPVVSPEDLVVLKLIAGRQKDIEDARTVLLAQKDAFDTKYTHALLVQVEEALGQSDLVALFEQLCAKC